MFNLFSLFSEIKIKINMKIHKNDRKVETAPFVEQSSGNDPVTRVQNMKGKKYNVPCVFNISSLICILYVSLVSAL